MNAATKAEIGLRFRRKREEAGYTRERLGELCALSPRFIANIELGDSTFSLDSLMTVCRVLSCSADHLLFGDSVNRDAWAGTVEKLEHLNVKYRTAADKIILGLLEAVAVEENETGE